MGHARGMLNARYLGDLTWTILKSTHCGLQGLSGSGGLLLGHERISVGHALLSGPVPWYLQLISASERPICSRWYNPMDVHWALVQCMGHLMGTAKELVALSTLGGHFVGTEEYRHSP